MRHHVSGRKFSRPANQRKNLFRSLAKDFILNNQIETTLAKAKAIKPIVEKLITKGKGNCLSSRRLIFAFLQSIKATNKLVDEIAPLFKERPGGFTRIVRLGKRLGDGAPIVRLELVEKPAAKKVAAKNETKKEVIEKTETKPVINKKTVKKAPKKIVKKPRKEKDESKK